MKQMQIEVELGSYYMEKQKLILRASWYPIDNSPAWQLFTPEGEAMITPTVCLKDYDLLPSLGYVFIKSYSENQGIYESLVAEGIIAEGHQVFFGNAFAYHCEILNKELRDAAGA